MALNKRVARCGMLSKAGVLAPALQKSHLDCWRECAGASRPSQPRDWASGTILARCAGGSVLFVPERLNGIEAGGFPRGPDAKDQTNPYAGNKTANGRPERHVRWH